MMCVRKSFRADSSMTIFRREKFWGEYESILLPGLVFPVCGELLLGYVFLYLIQPPDRILFAIFSLLALAIFSWFCERWHLHLLVYYNCEVHVDGEIVTFTRKGFTGIVTEDRFILDDVVAVEEKNGFICVNLKFRNKPIKIYNIKNTQDILDELGGHPT